MSTEPTDEKTKKVEFLQHHLPALESGLYQVEVVQQLSTTGTPKRTIPLTDFTAERSFFVAGARFRLEPGDIEAVFPPDGSLGDHSNVLPHVVFTRSTLPWERTAQTGRRDVPWLALLLFDDGEKPTPAVVPLSQLLAPSVGAVNFPGLGLEPGQKADDKVTVIDVKRSLLEAMLPSARELKKPLPRAPQLNDPMPSGCELGLLAHVRQKKDAAGQQVGEELAVVIGNRLPRKGAVSTAHLVSLEERYAGGDFDYQGAAADGLIRLVSLKSWSFACADAGQDFKGLLMRLNRRHTEAGTLRLPASGDAEADAYLGAGFAPLPHSLRQGSRTVSWYRGPFIPGPNRAGATSPARAADQLVRYNARDGMFDVSYAAAWELGRLLALQSKQLSVRLYHWKRAQVQRLKREEQQPRGRHLPQLSQPFVAEQPPAEITRWFSDLSVLRGVPFNYLVPDERLLPAESIRFFHLDRQWVDCLLDGASSLGRITKSDHEVPPPLTVAEQRSGLLLRSNVVAGWPGLLVDAFDAEGLQLKPVRADRLSQNVLLCLFAGVLRRVEIHQKPEMLHFGFEAVKEQPGGFRKVLRDQNGRTTGPTLPSIPWLDAGRRVVDIGLLAKAVLDTAKLTQLTAAQLALHMVEGVEKVTLQFKG